MDTSLLLALPDCVLLAVLAHLSPRELFTCRVVSRRLRDMCLHPALWRRISLMVSKGLLRAALRLAPCLLEVYSTVVGLEALAPMVSETACVIEKLVAKVDSQADVTLATSVLQRLSGLGGLKTLFLALHDAPTETLPPLLRTVYSLNDLRVLHIWMNSDPPLPAVSSWGDTGRTSALTELRYTSLAMDSFLEVLLTTHRATLEKVTLTKVGSLPVDLLNAMPKLRSLSCVPSDALLQLDVPTLRALTLKCMSGAYPAGALAFLEASSQLQTVTLHLTKESPAAPLQALARSRSAHLLRHLFLKFTPGFLDLLAPSLASFPSLRVLSVDSEPTNGFLQAVTPTALPCLTTLGAFSFTTCLHARLHDPATQDFLIRNPRLHLRFSHAAQDGCACCWCRWGCHSQLWATPSGLGSAFSSHSRGAGCPADCIQVAVAPCQGCDRPTAKALV